MFVAKNIENKQRIESEFYEILSKYIYKYLNRVLKNEYEYHKASKIIGHLYPNYQKKLLKISKWPEYKIDKEYSKFLKWCSRKYNKTENQLQIMLNDIIILTIQVMIHKPSLYVEKLLENSFPSMRDFYYKCLRRLARVFYEAPKSTKSITLSELKRQINTTINIFLPTKKIDTVLQIQEPEHTQQQIENITYDFNKLDTRSSSSSIKSRGSGKSSISKEQILYYISSDKSSNIESDKYTENYGIHNQINNEIDLLSEDKEIYIPKKQKYYFNKSKIDEINEYFFNE